MAQNLRHYCKQRVEALADKQCRLGYISSQGKHGIDQGANKIPYDSLSNLKIY